VTYTANSAVVTATFPGDANLDGKVDVADLGILASNWQLSGTWATGDFDGTGSVNVADLGLLASNWQAGVGSAPGPGWFEALRSFGLGAEVVPEPSGQAILIGAACMRRWRRSGRSRRLPEPP
jgi:hypothetical protein